MTVIDEDGKRYIVLEVHCVSCHEPLKPQETEMDLFRIGMPCHKPELRPQCLIVLEGKLKDAGWITDSYGSAP